VYNFQSVVAVVAESSLYRLVIAPCIRYGKTLADHEISLVFPARLFVEAPEGRKRVMGSLLHELAV